ncbi:MAG: hypothetical protein GWP10_08980, partial [Nitrospiraceae bacterium]|nr:hypothetical protein [Nitrospiraceae bacterium]
MMKIYKIFASTLFAVGLLLVLTFAVGTGQAGNAGIGTPPVTPASSLTETDYHSLYIPAMLLDYSPVDGPALSWASGPEGVLLRWRWPHPYPRATQYEIYRDGSLISTAGKVADETQAIAILGDETWKWLQQTYSVTTIAGLHTFLDHNPMAEHWLADQKYPVALVRGLGYLDKKVQQGTFYTYQVKAITSEGVIDVGQVVVKHTGFTPLPAPTGLQEVQVVSDTLRSSPNWARAQQNRKADSRVFLRWNLPTKRETSAPWIASYDVYRATSRNGPYERINVTNGEDKPVIPMPSYTPPGEVGSYQQYPYFYADDDPNLQACHRYYYRVAPRDLLGHIADWNDPLQSDLFSDPILAIPPDTEPPAAPLSVTATADNLSGVITVTWNAVTDAVQYVVYRSTDPAAAWPGTQACVTCTTWTTKTTTSGTSWVDTGATHELRYETRYWYVVRAPPNMSAPSRAVSAILHDRTPPGQCHIESSPRHPYMHITCGDDTTNILVYCKFDGGPELLVKAAKAQTLDYDLSTFYTPTLPIRADCRAVAVDEHGNRALPSNWAAGLPLVPPSLPTPSAPILHPISTTVGGNHGWTAHLHWDAIDTPCMSGFRVYREAPGVREARIADESTLGREKRSFADPDVQWGVVYTYTVAAYGAGGICGTAKEIRSQPVVYRVVQPPNYPGRTVDVLPWGSRRYDDQGTHLSWVVETKRLLYVVLRSIHRDFGYVALTPPMERTSYLDTSAHHDRYWYMVLALDPTTGEPFAATSPWSAGGGTQSYGSQAAGQSPSREAPNLPANLPSVLHFGDGFDLHVTYYYDSSLKDLNGEGALYLNYPSAKNPTQIYLFFSHLQAKSDGTVTHGSVSVPSDSSSLPIQVDQGFRYDITALTVDPNGGTGNVTLYLPASVYYHWHLVYPFPWTGLDDHVLLGNAVIHSDLRFQRVLTWSLPCEDTTLTYFQLEDLPWKIIPSGPTTYTNSSITFKTACALYLERYTDDRPAAGEPDANDGLLRATYTGAGTIEPDGLAGTFHTTANVHYGTAFPYGFELTLIRPTLVLDGGIIVSGTAQSSYLLARSSVRFDYFQHVARVNPHHGAPQDTPEGHWEGTLSHIQIGRGGSIYAIATRAVMFPPVPYISWLNGLTLQNTDYELYIPPLQSTRYPWKDALWPTGEHARSDGKRLESGLNLRTTDNAHLVWSGCSTNGPITFPNGVTADLYIRRGGVSDLVQAHIPTGSPMSVELDGYQTRLQSFTLVFFDNALYDQDFSGDFYLPGPSDVLIPFRDATLDAGACIQSADVVVTSITPKYWQTTLHPDALEFREPGPDPTAPGTRGLWLIGGVDVPHMAPADATEEVAAIPLETAFKPNGEFYEITPQYDRVNYLLDGFAYLLSGVRLSDWASHEAPAWDAHATLASPPAGSWDEHG